jgi:hypothetical protein
MPKVTEFVKSADGKSIVLAVPYAEAYIPSDIIGDPEKGNPVAYQFGDGIRTIGLFNMRFYPDEDADRESTKLRTFKYPNVITMYPSDKEDNVQLQLDPDMDPDKYCVLKFYEGDIIMSTKNQQKSQNCEAFMNQLIKGKLPKGLNYMDLYFAWDKNFDINGMNPGVPAITLQLIISENCRAKGDPMKQFRKIVNNEGVTLYDYKVHNMVDICSNSSVFNALIFERFSEMLTSSINMTKEGVKQNTTPLEKIVTM